MNKRTALLDAIRTEQANVVREAERLHQRSVKHAGRAHRLLGMAGRAGPMRRAILVWVATLFEGRANAGFLILRQRRAVIKAASETADHGHRSARRQINRDAT